MLCVGCFGIIYATEKLSSLEGGQGMGFCVCVCECVWERERNNMCKCTVNLFNLYFFNLYIFLYISSVENAGKSEKWSSHTAAICGKLVCHFSHSWKKRAALQEAQRQFKLSNHGLIAKCQTRWGSRLAVIDRILGQKKAPAEVLSEETKTRYLVLRHKELNVLELVSNALGSLLEFTDALLGEDHVSGSLSTEYFPKSILYYYAVFFLFFFLKKLSFHCF